MSIKEIVFTDPSSGKRPDYKKLEIVLNQLTKKGVVVYEPVTNPPEKATIFIGSDSQLKGTELREAVESAAESGAVNVRFSRDYLKRK